MQGGASVLMTMQAGQLQIEVQDEGGGIRAGQPVDQTV